jgi:hypothetical protein
MPMYSGLSPAVAAAVEALAPEPAAVLAQVRQRKALPLLEIAAKTGIRGDTLKGVVRSLAEKNFVIVTKLDDPASAIVSIASELY